MKKKARLLLFFLLSFLHLHSQTNLQIHYANGQNFLQWEMPGQLPESFKIYKSESQSLMIEDWDYAGQLFPEMAVPASLRLHIDPVATFAIPDGMGGMMTLGADEGLFVETVRTDGDYYYAVIPCSDGSCIEILDSAQITDNAHSYIYDSSDHIIPHLQIEGDIGQGIFGRIYYLWSEGRSDHWNERPDFPVMGNEHTNGWPHLFSVWLGPNSDLSSPLPTVHWLHGGSGNFTNFFPGKFQEINVSMNEGMIVCHNDDFQRFVTDSVIFNVSNSWWFGWSQNHNPFEIGYPGPADQDTIINYSQRRIKWIHDWLVAEGLTDSKKTAIQGYSVGSAGTMAMIKTYPELFSIANIFSCGHQGPDDANFGALLLGTPKQNLLTNLVKPDGNNARIWDLYDLKTKISDQEWPLIRSWHGKNDINPTMGWDEYLIDQIHYADSAGVGYQFYWDEREHPPSKWDGHWSFGLSITEQTEKDNSYFQEKYRANQSYPSFHGFRLYPYDHNNPGNGETNDGDDWGTWGGYHEWDLESIEDKPEEWSAIIYLTGESNYPLDNFPANFPCLESSVTLHRLQNFVIAPMADFEWSIQDAQGTVIKSGQAISDASGKLTIEGIVACKDPKRAKLTIKKIDKVQCSSDTGLDEEPGTYCTHINVNGVDRYFTVVVPNTYNPNLENKVLFLFHGGGGNMNSFLFSQIDPNGNGGREELFEKAEMEGFLLVAPTSLVNPINLNTMWNTQDYYPQTNSTWADDLGFIEQLVEEIKTNYNIDEDRIFAAGYSKGGDFSQLLGVTFPCTFAGVGSIGSSSGEQVALNDTTLEFNPIGDYPVPVLMVKGEFDYKRPWEGGLNYQGNNTSSGFQDIAYWMENNGCDPNSLIESVIIPDSITLYQSLDCQSGTQVNMIYGHHLLHIWADGNDMAGWNANTDFIDFFTGISNIEDCKTANEVIEYQNDFFISPNPATNEVVIKINPEKEIKRLSILNMSTKILGDLEFQKSSTNEIKTNVSHLPPSVYAVLIQTNEEVISSKIIIH